MDITINCKNVDIAPDGRYLTVGLSGAEQSDFLNEIDIDDAIKHYTIKELLDNIGEDEARKHFKIEEE